MIGVNANSLDPAQLKAIMEEEGLNWRSLADDGTINTAWNSPGTPTYYCLDHKGVIRRKWVSGYPGREAIDSALDELIEEAENAADKPPR